MERMQKIARWEACSENSAEFRAAAAQIDAELQSETRRGVVAVTDIDEDDAVHAVNALNARNARNARNATPGHVQYACTEAPGADDSGVDSEAENDSDEYESSFIDDDELSSVEGSESCVSSMCETSESNSTDFEADAEAEVDADVDADADVNKMLFELPGATENFDNCLGPWPVCEDVNYSHDDSGLDALDVLGDLNDLDALHGQADKTEIVEEDN